MELVDVGFNTLIQPIVAPASVLYAVSKVNGPVFKKVIVPSANCNICESIVASMASEEDNDDEFLYSESELEAAEDDDVDWEDVAPSQPVAGAPAVALEAPGSLAAAPEPPESGGDEDGGDEDLEWEDATQEEAEEEPDVAGDQEGGEQVDWEEVNRSLEQEARAEAAAADKKRKRRRAVRMTKEDKARELALHQSHLLVLLALHLEWNELSRSPLLRGLLLSLTAGQAFDFFADMKTRPLAYSLELLVRWFHSEFIVSATLVDDDDDDDSDGQQSQKPLLSEARLMTVFFERKGTEYELAVLFTTLCRALRLHCRYVCAMDPLVVRNGSSFFESTATGRPSQSDRRRQQYERKKRIRTALTVDKRVAASVEGPQESADSNGNEEDEQRGRRQFYWIWTEVLDEATKMWVHVDVARRIVGRPRDVEALRGKSAPFSYVVALFETGRVLDVTSRYANTWSKTLTLRLADAWLGVAIDQVNRQLLSDPAKTLVSFKGQVGGGMTLAEIDELLVDETQRLEAMRMSEAMPTAVEAFRKHHVYCLERHLGRFECVHPRKAVGVFNGEPVFLRASVQRLQSAFKWRRLGREVTTSERSTPARWYNPNNRSQDGGGGGGDDEPLDADDERASRGGRTGSMALFGLWQTSEIVPPEVVDGVLPKNKYGNVEVWSPAHVPRGAVHLRLPRIEQVAKQLGVDYAQAVVGFERQGPMGRAAPQVDGIVVVKAVETVLVDAHAAMQQATIERAIEKNQRIAARRWGRLAKRLLLRQRLEDDYGKV